MGRGWGRILTEERESSWAENEGRDLSLHCCIKKKITESPFRCFDFIIHRF